MERKQWLDNARALACLMVIAVHVTIITKHSFGKIDNIYWYVTVIIDSATRMCVPIFFMISGYIFLGEKNVKLKNIIRIFTALTFYSILCMAYLSIFKGRVFLDGLLTIYQEPSLYHLWFLFYIFSFYILFLIMNIRNINPFLGLLVVIIVMTAFNSNLSEIIRLTLDYTIKNNFAINSFYLQLFMYCFAGAFIGRIDDGGRYVLTAWLVCLLSILAVVLLTVFKSFMVGKLDSLYQGYNSIPVFFSSISAFYILRNQLAKKSLEKYINYISERSLAIYGVHVIFLEIIRMKQFYITSNPLINLVITYLLVLFMSVVTASIIRLCDKKGYVS